MPETRDAMAEVAAIVPEMGNQPRRSGLLGAGVGRAVRHPAFGGVIVFLVSLGVFLWGIDAPKDIYFDETWYVPTARAWLRSGQMLHQEHPPLGKLLIASSLWLFGDNPWGWRAMSALFGAVTISAVWLWSLALLRDSPRALWVAAVTLVDAVVFVQARIAMLDIFLMAFSVLSLALFTLSMKETRSPRRAFLYALAMGVSLGLAGACKWSGFFLAMGLLAIVALIGLLRVWKVRFEDPRPGDFYTRDRASAWTLGRTFLAFLVAPFLAYFLSYVPQMLQEGSIAEFAASHRRMLDIWAGHSADHPYMSLWYSWPILRRPVWYLFEIRGHDAALWSAANPAAAIVGLANPIVVYAGQAAMALALWNWLARREFDSMIVVVGFLSQYLPWAANPKGLEFSYYYFPSILCLGPALALAFFRERSRGRTVAALAFLAAAGLSFTFFLPVLAAGIGVGPDGLNARVWLSSWR
jgi:dolichyl-phosphate-mannose-protein mannosyltransferase